MNKKFTFVPYNPNLKKFAQNLRKNGSKAELVLWNKLKTNQLGYDFHRQKPILGYIVDFYMPELGLVIEVDGISHVYKAEDDVNRDADLIRLGLTVLRFSDNEILNNTEGVVNTIIDWIERHVTSSPTLPRGRANNEHLP
ncbi:MAG: hypothetical protein A3H59_03670 [Candidatus Jacksonbacteria bacterium RIFCSPLOWO2_02_FULL_43_9]|nr:MAG: hypothetical protein A3B94_02390 [Candidatus Jacksonbacteria bacterium RIFCSPHIGHO2_02_FULL_43_10]OGY70748.1 MAG: hypothetical protein A2986_02955 [Candidatus Jacksonbacteria bacterium RIFCSPLOWO2_01_FULL_44_13]OGY74310.1 MAG: hypothetical protein A3H59_03670 [Candidatus Jacksonbacteria bacterium RIFCSPLOWO2_02_FULL_43_9]HAZ16701.1 hypothetical protein [Candidatus Jacksonbacteria bacterium]